MLLKNPNKRTKPVMGKIMKAVRDLPYIARRSITFDRGTEFVSWPHLQAEIGTQTWFCDPSSPWQKGTVETPVEGSEDGFRPSATSGNAQITI